MKRIDVVLTEKGEANSRVHAQKLITRGCVEVYLDGTWQRIKKPSLKVDDTVSIRVQSLEEDQYVSRGGVKLALALQHLSDQYQFSLQDKTVLDVGQSTGGFTDCALQAGAKSVVGVDVGKDQLAPSLKNDERVLCFEGVNARRLSDEKLEQYTPQEQGFDAVVMDVSFISQTLIVPELPEVMKPGAYLISLVKPQFEVGKDGIGKGGIVRSPELYPMVKEKIEQACLSAGLKVQMYFESPIQGGDGNREFLLIARFTD
ncbi:TlyA family RNA methyltransferase [Marinibactrum halimedae]|uniref:TlyA family rRNA (Cytidine-2'-O)-methyltransferase n=1 Tax=Marinibactrum halimedae TaxID=1444977 RepID=A0AA37WP91_9GAMM|nr:TlyA family RNA methyltransferase [Marinibactrum halimedae]MCD9459996.1 TlyA family RNA methyltransferase [Marinibactrum halimedae]GLS28235.1 TlyA family rRNA (cytidine-2'-O)-methyltransferase [Marinibactrum halimedae]